MNYVALDDRQMPALGLGTWQLQGEHCQQVVAMALELGYRHLDTAQGYENEAEVGRAIEASAVAREDIFVTTKVWPDDMVKDAGCIDASLERLRVQRVDLLLMHWPSPTLPLARTLEPLLAAREAGKAAVIGVSNFPPGLLAEAVKRAPIACNQVEYHPYLDQRRLRDCARELGVMITAYSPLARGGASQDETLGLLAKRRGKTAAQVTLRWLLQRGVAAVPKASSREHLRSNLDIFDFALTEEELAEIDGLARGERLIDPDWGPEWGPDWQS